MQRAPLQERASAVWRVDVIVVVDARDVGPERRLDRAQADHARLIARRHGDDMIGQIDQAIVAVDHQVAFHFKKLNVVFPVAGIPRLQLVQRRRHPPGVFVGLGATLGGALQVL